jgi:hypothetical protein
VYKVQDVSPVLGPLVRRSDLLPHDTSGSIISLVRVDSFDTVRDSDTFSDRTCPLPEFPSKKRLGSRFRHRPLHSDNGASTHADDGGRAYSANGSTRSIPVARRQARKPDTMTEDSRQVP